MLRWYVGFIRSVSVDRIGKAGVIITTSAFISFILFELTRVSGINNNAYAGLVSYLALPVIFVIGLILIAIAWWWELRRSRLSARELIDKQFDKEKTSAGFLGSGVVKTVGLLTLANVVFLTLAGSRMLTFMDEPHFCGTACHSVMHPEWITYQESPHARVACVECHVGEGVDALIDSKLNGMWQMISVTFNLYERPIPTPVHQLRPARETCEKCHWPSKFYGSRIDQLVHYGNDSTATPAFTTLSLKIDTGTTAGKGGIHWHIAEENEVRYTSVRDQRETIIWAEARQSDGSFKRFYNQRLSGSHEEELPRVMDCVDCHNRATHIYERPEDAVDKRLVVGLLPEELPYIKREAVTALTIGYTDSAAAMEGIENQLYGFYRREFPNLLTGNTVLIDSAIEILRDVYRRNIHHRMNVTWNAYPSFIGHDGCFRCHNQNLIGDDGSRIDHDCTLCHSIAAYDSEIPFQFLLAPDTADPSYFMHEYLRNEFFNVEVEASLREQTIER